MLLGLGSGLATDRLCVARPDWTASALVDLCVPDSLLAVRVPTGAAAVHLAYRPHFMYVASAGALAALAGSLLAVIRLST